MQEYRVEYREKGTRAVLGFVCMADDEEHAKEQARDESTVGRILRVSPTSTAWADAVPYASPRHHYPIGRADIEGVARTIARVWYKDQIRSLSSTFFLYWRTAKAGERVAIPVLSTEHDATGLTEHTRGLRVSIAWTENEAARHIADWMWTLPILGAAEG